MKYDLTSMELDMILAVLKNERDVGGASRREFIDGIIAKIEFHRAMAAVEELSL